MLAVCYNGLWKLLIDKKIAKGKFAEICELPSGVLNKLRNDIPVHLKVMERICIELDCKIEDIVEITKEDKQKKEMC